MSDFKCVLVEDARIAQITDQETFAVQSSAAQSTYTQFQSVSSSASSIVWNLQIPSENIAVDRNILMQTDLTFTVDCASVPIGESAFQYGLTDCVQAFPLNSLLTTAQCTINNTSVSTNYQDVLPMLMRLNDKRQLSRWNSMTPSYPDCAYGVYKDGVLANNNPLAAYSTNSYDEDFVPRGAYPVKILIKHYIGGVLTDDSVISTNVTDTWVIEVKLTVTEPFLFLSPWINTGTDAEAALIGLNNLSFVLNIDATCKRLFSTANTYLVDNGLPGDQRRVQLGSYIKKVSLGTSAVANPFANTRLLFNFLSLHPESYAKLKTKNVVNYFDYPRYLTVSNNASPLLAYNPTTKQYYSQTITSQSIQLNQISDLILICARVPMSQQTCANTSGFLTITNITCNFNNAAGLLSSATRNNLFELSNSNGSSQSFYEFGGLAINNDNATGNVREIPTTGSLLVINPVYQFNLPAYLSSSSLGQYQFQFNVTVTNQYPFDIQPELCIVTVNSGLFVTQQGSSSIFTGILTKNQVLETKEQNPVPHLDSQEYERLVGGKLGNRGMSNVAKMMRMMRTGEKPSGMSGMSEMSRMSGAGESGGRRGRLSKHL